MKKRLIVLLALLAVAVSLAFASTPRCPQCGVKLGSTAYKGYCSKEHYNKAVEHQRVEKAKKEAAAKKEAEERSKKDAEERAKKEAEEKAKREAEQKKAGKAYDYCSINASEDEYDDCFNNFMGY